MTYLMRNLNTWLTWNGKHKAKIYCSRDSGNMKSRQKLSHLNKHARGTPIHTWSQELRVTGGEILREVFVHRSDDVYLFRLLLITVALVPPLVVELLQVASFVQLQHFQVDTVSEKHTAVTSAPLKCYNYSYMYTLLQCKLFRCPGQKIP